MALGVSQLFLRYRRHQQGQDFILISSVVVLLIRLHFFSVTNIDEILKTVTRKTTSKVSDDSFQLESDVQYPSHLGRRQLSNRLGQSGAT